MPTELFTYAGYPARFEVKQNGRWKEWFPPFEENTPVPMRAIRAPVPYWGHMRLVVAS